jgi:hypothetical protein
MNAPVAPAKAMGWNETSVRAVTEVGEVSEVTGYLNSTGDDHFAFDDSTPRDDVVAVSVRDVALHERCGLVTKSVVEGGNATVCRISSSDRGSNGS